MPIGYCTVDDVRRALLEAELPGDAAQERRLVIDAIAAQSEPVEKILDRHWYVPTGAVILDEDTDDLIPTDPKTRNDEHDIPTHGGFVHGASEDRRRRASKNTDSLLESGPRYEHRRRDYRDHKEEIRVALRHPGALEQPRDEDVPAYTRITLERKDVKSLPTLSVINETGGYDDWVASTDYSGGVGLTNRGEDYWVRINNGGVSELYLDVHAMADEIASFANAVYVKLEYGHEGLPRNVRRGIGCLAGAELVEDSVIEIPQNATVYNIETKADELRARADGYLSEYLPDGESFLEAYQG
jgi:hypothetical protein